MIVFPQQTATIWASSTNLVHATPTFEKPCFLSNGSPWLTLIREIFERLKEKGLVLRLNRRNRATIPPTVLLKGYRIDKSWSKQPA